MAPTLTNRVEAKKAPEAKAPEAKAADAKAADAGGAGEAQQAEGDSSAPNDETPTEKPELKAGSGRLVPIPDMGRRPRESEAGNDYVAESDGRSTA